MYGGKSEPYLTFLQKILIYKQQLFMTIWKLEYYRSLNPVKIRQINKYQSLY